MKRVEDLREVADETLSGLEAGPALRHRILSAAQAQTQPKRALRFSRGWAVALSCALALAVALPIALSRNTGADTGGEADHDGVVIQDVAAGQGPVGNEIATLRNSQVNVTQRNKKGAGGIWEGSGSSFSLIRVDGKYYRLLNGVELDDGQLGASLGTVSLHTGQPELADPSGIVSNHAPEGAEVYAVRGMGGTLVACAADGQLQLYQRVSFGGHGLVSGESRLSDVMQIRGHVTALSLTGQETIEGSEAERLFDILADNAVFIGNGSRSGRQILIITLDNGAAVQMIVDGDQFSGCGQWSCPEFIEALAQR